MCVCVGKIKSFCRSLVTRRRNGGQYLRFSREFPEKIKYVTIYFYCTIREPVKDLSYNKNIKQIYGKDFLYFLTLNGITIDYSVDPSSPTKRFRCDSDVTDVYWGKQTSE